MKKTIFLALALTLLQSTFFTAFSPIKSNAQTKENLTNQSVVEMVKSELSDEIIISLIKTSKNTFDTSPSELLQLKKSGVSDAVILALVQSTSKSENGSSTENSVSSNPSETITLLDGTPVKLRIGRTLSSADAKTGDTVDFEVLEDVKINDLVIIPRGGIAIATVTRAKPKGRMGKGGKLDINIDFVRLATNEKVALRAIKETKGKGKTGVMTGAIVASSILFFPAAPFFLFMKGKDITIPKGTEITAYVNSDIPLDSGKFNVSTSESANLLSPEVKN